MIDIEEIKRASEQNSDTIVIGTSESGLAQVTERAKKEIRSKGIDLIINITGEATRIFNQLMKEGKKKIIGLFHLSC